jgi:hypothetical protein
MVRWGSQGTSGPLEDDDALADDDLADHNRADDDPWDGDPGDGDPGDGDPGDGDGATHGSGVAVHPVGTINVVSGGESARAG